MSRFRYWVMGLMFFAVITVFGMDSLVGTEVCPSFEQVLPFNT